MKIFQYISVLFLGIVLFASCSEDDKLTYYPDEAVESILSLPEADAFIFTKDDADEDVTFKWTQADPGLSVQVDYIVELSTTNLFESVTSLIETRDTVSTIKVSAINNALIALEYEPGVESMVYCRVLARLNDNVEDISSAFKEYTTTPYETLIDYPMIYVPGKYQGWNPGAENGRLYSYNFDDIYEGIIHITETAEQNGEFKINDGTNWIGGVLAQAGDNYSGTLGGDDNFVVAPGAYMFRVDMDAMTIELTKTDYWGIIGTAIGGWGDTDDYILHYDGQRELWVGTNIDFVEGPFKFRANNKWDKNFSGEGNISERDGDGNIVMSTAGEYDVAIDPEAQTFSVLPSKE